jgi:hypothetical protein
VAAYVRFLVAGPAASPSGTFAVASILVIACLVVIAVLIDTFLLNRRVRRRR